MNEGCAAGYLPSACWLATSSTPIPNHGPSVPAGGHVMQAGSVRTRRSNRGPRMVAALGMVVTCLAGSAAGAQAGPRTQAERTGYLETSSHESVMAFLDSLVRPGRPIAAGVMGKTTEGRDLKYVIVSRPLFATPDAARRSGRPIVFVQGNIHSGEVEGKEALQALVRDLLLDARPNVLDSI